MLPSLPPIGDDLPTAPLDRTPIGHGHRRIRGRRVCRPPDRHPARTLRRWVADGKLPATRAGRKNLVSLGDVERVAAIAGRPIGQAAMADEVAGHAAAAMAGHESDSSGIGQANGHVGAISPAARSQLEAIRDKWLRPLIAEIGQKASRSAGSKNGLPWRNGSGMRCAPRSPVSGPAKPRGHRMPPSQTPRHGRLVKRQAALRRMTVTVGRSWLCCGGGYSEAGKEGGAECATCGHRRRT